MENGMINTEELKKIASVLGIVIAVGGGSLVQIINTFLMFG